ncbi:unnamed protein product [Mycena citricolor]|uniref:DUF6534 domain-containing protein n=1 Tax=Mycena citricolor TaxID=2018698 RepID=A0AAD2Q1R7_9AGAR|nr:unnamed protein product [Mycena citricolor]
MVTSLKDIPELPQGPTPAYGPEVSSQLIGTLLSFLLGGMFFVQVCIYHTCFKRDRWPTRALVHAVALLIFLRTVLTGVEAHIWFAEGFGDIERFIDVHDLRIYTPVIGPLTALLVELFFCYRIVLLERRAWPVALGIALIAFAQCVCGTASGLFYYLGANPHSDPRHHTFLEFTRAFLLTGVVSAGLITGTTSYILLTAPVTPATRMVLKNLVWLIAETNAMSAIVEIVAFALIMAFPGRRYFSCSGMILPGIYANTLLATLNHRAIAGVRSRRSSAFYALDSNPGAGLQELVSEVGTFHSRPGSWMPPESVVAETASYALSSTDGDFAARTNETGSRASTPNPPGLEARSSSVSTAHVSVRSMLFAARASVELREEAEIEKIEKRWTRELAVARRLSSAETRDRLAVNQIN